MFALEILIHPRTMCHYVSQHHSISTQCSDGICITFFNFRLDSHTFSVYFRRYRISFAVAFIWKRFAIISIIWFRWLKRSSSRAPVRIHLIGWPFTKIHWMHEHFSAIQLIIIIKFMSEFIFNPTEVALSKWTKGVPIETIKIIYIRCTYLSLTNLPEPWFI